jgi:hypothetical protein
MAFPIRLRSAALFPALLCAAMPAASAAAAPIDREALVARHGVRVDHVDPENALSLGNGDFAFNVDVTGLQSFGELYHDKGVPLETRATWAWHSFPNPSGLKLEDAMKPYPFHGRTIQYAALQDSPAGAYFRENPNPQPLGEISLLYQGRVLAPSELSHISQTLDLWTGVVRSTYTLAGQPVVVETVAHSERSLLAIRIVSPLIQSHALQVRFHFPYSYRISVKSKPPLVWDQPDRHRTEVVRQDAGSLVWRRTVDDSQYYVKLGWEGAGRITTAGPHDFRLEGPPGDTLAFTCSFSPADDPAAPLTFADTKAASAQGWRDYWTKGGVVDLSGSTDPRAAELERRIVLSQYLMKVEYAGSFPPAESGLVHVSWYGKHNSEVYFWHAAQFYEWGHVDLLEKGLGWYRKILPAGMAVAASQGLEGVRWPKMSGPDGRTGPGTINPFIIWNQPNPIYLCELVYRAHPDRATLDKYQDVVFESAKFLASFAFYDRATDRYVLGPPVKAASEKTEENDTRNPTFELAYWYYGLQVAQAWRERLGLAPEPHWSDIMAKLSPLPVSDGKYLEIETSPEIYRQPGGIPTSELMALGYLPLTPKVDLETVRRTFDEVNRRSRNGIKRWISWSMGEGAMTAARLGEPALAVGIVTNDAPAARFRNNGLIPRAAEPLDLPAYLPTNAALLDAVGLMAAGWDGAPPVNAPGFPQDGTWVVRAEGLNRMP